MKDKVLVTPERIGANIRRLRLLHQQTQQELGDLIGYGATTVANYERGYRLPNVETFIMIAIYYHADIKDFIQSDVHET